MSSSQSSQWFIDTNGSRGQHAVLSTHTYHVYKLKVVIVGDMSVGKTSLASRFTNDKFEEGHKPTVCASFLSRVVHSNGDTISFQIWDTAGQERYHSLVPMYLRGAHIALVVYDVTNPKSFASVGIWLDAIRTHGDVIKTVLVAAKCDLESMVDNITAVEFAQSLGLQFVKTSAKTGDNVGKLFLTLGAKAVMEIKRAENDSNLIPRSIVHSAITEGSPTFTLTEEEERHTHRHKNCCNT